MGEEDRRMGVTESRKHRHQRRVAELEGLLGISPSPPTEPDPRPQSCPAARTRPATDDGRAARLEVLRRAIAEGTYRIDPRDVAEQIVRRLLLRSL
jgi:hypothetical protein